MRPILHQVRTPSLPRRRRVWPSGASGTPSTAWIVNNGALSFTQGDATPFNVAATLPAGYTAGGVFGIDPANAALPTGMALTDAGILTVGSAAAGTQPGIVFSYHEPGALAVLTVHSTGAGTGLPVMATAYPTEGAVPANMVLVSPDEPTLSSSVLSAWPDGSAQVVVLACHTDVAIAAQKPIRLRTGNPSGAALTTADVASKFTTGIVFTNFGGGTQTLNSWGSPDRIWWANSQVICARYRQSLGVGALEAVVDVHAFAGGRAFVEVVVENCRMNTAAPSAPAAQSYTGATVTVNGAGINGAGTSSTWAGGSTHQPFRSWYCSGWIGGDPGIAVTHDTASLQAHPALFKVEMAAAYNFDSYVPDGNFFGVTQTYGTDAYVPWSFGRHMWSGMGQTGGRPDIGHLPQWEARYIQSGHKAVRNAVIASALALKSFPVNYRDTTTNLPPTFAQLSGKSFGAGFPKTGSIPFSNYNSYEWDYAHSPAVGLVAFLCRPSPCFIETAQSIAAFQGMAYADQTMGFYFETRAKAWCLRNLVQATFLTPSNSNDANVPAWKASAQANITANVNYFRQWETDPEQRLNVVFSYAPGWYRDDGAVSNPATFGNALWMHHWLSVEAYRAANVKLLAGAEQASLQAFADWCLLQPVRFINESVAGEWRYCGAYNHNIGTQDGNESNEGRATTIGMPATWGAARALTKVESPPSLSGNLNNLGTEEFTTYSVGWTSALAAGDYTSMYFAALVSAVERGVTGAETAWSTFTTNVTNLTTFRNLAAQDPRHNIWPRNK